MDATCDSLDLGYALHGAWAKLKSVWSTHTALTFGLADVERYDWEHQTITLTIAASNALVDRFWSPGRPKDPEEFLGARAFVVLVDGEPIYGGLFMRRISAMAIKYPVAYPRWSGDRLELTMRPVHMIGVDLGALDPRWNGVRDERIHEFLRP